MQNLAKRYWTRRAWSLSVGNFPSLRYEMTLSIHIGFAVAWQMVLATSILGLGKNSKGILLFEMKSNAEARVVIIFLVLFSGDLANFELLDLHLNSLYLVKIGHHSEILGEVISLDLIYHELRITIGVQRFHSQFHCDS